MDSSGIGLTDKIYRDLSRFSPTSNGSLSRMSFVKGASDDENPDSNGNLADGEEQRPALIIFSNHVD